MDERIILQKLESLDRCIERLKSKKPSDIETFRTDHDLQDIIVLNLERAVQMCVDVASYIIAELEVRAPMTMSESFDQLHSAGVISKETTERMQKSVSFRNIAVLEYQTIDWDVVYATLNFHIKDFCKYAKEILEWMESTSSET